MTSWYGFRDANGEGELEIGVDDGTGDIRFRVLNSPWQGEVRIDVDDIDDVIGRLMLLKGVE